ncbi:MAG TPA: tetratricopeptide repeat protein [Thermoanaerobaculia bacterium]
MIRPTLIGIFLLTLLASIAGPNLALAPPDLTQALAAQEERVAGDPRDPVAWNDLGNLLVVVGRDAEAEQAYRQALDLAPGDPSVRFNLALLMQQDGRVKDAESELRQLLETDPRHAWAHYQLGVILAGRKDRADALDHYARALAYDPSLSFAENNPHIIDNPLFTEALLLSQRHGEPSASRVPRLYGEPERIVQLMLRQHEQTDAAGTTGESSTGNAGGSPPPFEDSPDAAGTPVDAARGARRGDPAPASAGTTVIGVPQPAEPGATPPSESAGRRTLTSGQVPSPPGTVQRDPRTQPGGRRPPATRVTPGRTPPPPPPRSSRYIPPSRRSSAQLELELLPEETPERYASATTDPRG